MKNLLDNPMICGNISLADAGIAHPVERHLAKVEVASSSLVARSIKKPVAFAMGFFHKRIRGYGGIGRHAGFRFQWATVQVQVLLPAPRQKNAAPFRFRGLPRTLLPFKIKTARPLHASCKLRHAAVLGFDFGFPGADSIYTQNRSGASYPRSCSLSSSMFFSA